MKEKARYNYKLLTKMCFTYINIKKVDKTKTNKTPREWEKKKENRLKKVIESTGKFLSP